MKNKNGIIFVEPGKEVVETRYKQIKTVTYPIFQSYLFDECINKLLVEGWHLVKRDYIVQICKPDEKNLLYAELEKEVVNYEKVNLETIEEK